MILNFQLFSGKKSTEVKKFNTEALKSIVQQISTADITETRTDSSNASDSSINVLLECRGRRKKAMNSNEDRLDNNIENGRYSIDGKPFYMRKSDIQQKANEIIERSIEKSVSIQRICPSTETSFHFWATEQRKKSIKDNLTPASTVTDDRSDASSRKSTNFHGAHVRQKHRRHKKIKNTLNNLMGYMYGKFTKPKLKRTQEADRFGIPFSMIDRAVAKHKRKQIQENVLRKVRLSHMGYQQPPSKDDSSDNESTQNVKRLALIRTPYFMIPTIKISQVRKRERFRNKYLRKDRLSRINLLLYGNGLKSGNESAAEDEGQKEEKEEKKKRSFLDIIAERMIANKPVSNANSPKLVENNNTESFANPIKTKYLAIVREQYEKQRKICEPNVSCG